MHYPSTRPVIKAISLGWLFALVFVVAAAGQTKRPAPKSPAGPLPKVTKIDQTRYAELIRPGAKPLLINFWATWCVPCREEFPDLVKIDGEYKGKIDFITISLDFEEELNTGVPQFLKEMKADMPTYLLVTPDESAAIGMISKEWGGGLPLTVLFAPNGERIFFHQGVVKPAELKAAIDKALKAEPAAQVQPLRDIYLTIDFVKIVSGRRQEAVFFYENNWKVYRDEAVRRGIIDSYELVEASSEKNADFDLMLVTRYRGKEQQQASEKNFEPILKELRPNGPKLLNALKPEEFRKNLFLYSGLALFAGHSVSPQR
jgi:thiol-disulfide isomerase/thioredoxin